MKISCTPISVKAAIRSGELDQQKYFELLAATGADATDILDTRSYSWFWTGSADVASLARRVRDCNLKIAAYAVGNSFTVRDPAEFDRQVGIVLNGIHEAAEAGAPCLRIFGGYHKDLPGENELDYAEGFQQILRGIEAVLPEARKCGVVLALENHGRMPGLSAELLQIMKYFDVPELGICFDICNFYANNMNETEDAVRAYSRLKEYIRHVHFKDRKFAPADSGKRVVPCVCGKGDGIVPLRQMIYQLEEDRFDGYCSLEHENPVLDEVVESLKYMRSLKECAALLYGEKK